MDLIAKLPTLAAAIYQNLYRDGKVRGHYTNINIVGVLARCVCQTELLCGKVNSHPFLSGHVIYGKN